MKRILSIFFFLLCIVDARSQLTSSIEKLEKDVKFGKEDTNKVKNLYTVCNEYFLTGEYAKGLDYGKQALALAQKLSRPAGCENNCKNLQNTPRTILTP